MSGELLESSTAAPPHSWLTSRAATAHALILVTVAVFLANAPTWLHLVESDPFALTGALNKVPHGILPGQPFADPNVGYTLQALGKQAAMQIMGGHLPWWNPYEGVGMPLAAEMQSGAFFPFTVLLSSVVGVTGLLMVLECLCGYATYFLLRRLHVGLVAATTGAIAFALCGAASWVTNAPVRPIFALPLCLVGIERCLDGRARWRSGRWALLALGLALSIVAGFPETAAIDGFFLVLWIICRLNRTQWSVAKGQLVEMTTGVVVGVLAAAPIVISFITYFPRAWVGPHTSQFAHLSLPTEGLVQWFFPYGLGLIDAVHLPGGPLWGGVGGYVQTSILAGAVLGLFGHSARRLRIGLGLFVVVMAARAFGFTPVVLLFGAIPGVKMVVFARYCMPSVELALVILCAMGLDDLGRLSVTKAHLQRAGAVLAAMFVTATVSSWLVLSGATTVHRTRRHPAGVVEAASHTSTILSAVFGLLLLGLLSLGVWLQWSTVEAQGRQRIRRNGGRLLVALVVVAESVVLFGLPQLSAPAAAQPDLAPVRFLRSHLGTQRFFTLGPYQANYGSAFSTSEVNVNDLPQPKNWVHFVERYLDRNVTPVSFTALARKRLRGKTPAQELIANLANYEAIGVKYVVVTPRAKDVLGIDFPSHHGPVWPNGPRLVFSNGTAKIYELPHPALIFSIRRAGGAKGTAVCSATVTSSSETTTICDSALTVTRRVLSMPEWKAYVDGTPVAIQPGEGVTRDLFQRVTVPAGTHHVAFRYEPPLGTPSVVTALLAWVTIAALLWRSATWRRQRSERHGETGSAVDDAHTTSDVSVETGDGEAHLPDR